MNAVGLKPLSAVYGEDVTHGKPDPAPYLLAAKRMQVAPEDCIVFEDTAAGVRSGQAAGMRVIAISPGQPKADLLIADVVIEDYRPLRIEQNPDGLRVDILLGK
jgi:sugar-phosphatase